MPTVEDFTLISASKEFLFDFTQDYNKRLDWDKYLGVARLIDAEKAEKGTLVYCESRTKIGMTVRYISLNRPEQVAMEMVKGPFIFENFSGSWRFKSAENGQTQVFFRYNFQTKWGFFSTLFIDFIIEQILKSDVRNRLRYLKEAVENRSL